MTDNYYLPFDSFLSKCPTLSVVEPSPTSPWEAVLQALANKTTAKRLEVEGYLRDLEQVLGLTENQLESVENVLKRDSPAASATGSPGKHVSHSIHIE